MCTDHVHGLTGVRKYAYLERLMNSTYLRAVQAWTMGPTQAELAMMVLARLIEDCYDADFRSEVRRIIYLPAYRSRAIPRRERQFTRSLSLLYFSQGTIIHNDHVSCVL